MKTTLYKLFAAASIAAASLGFISGQANAATYSLGCSGLLCNNTASSFDFSDDGIDLTVTGFIDGDPSKSRQVSQSVLGLGVLRNKKDPIGQVDSGLGRRARPETLRLTFDHAVELIVAEFRLVNEALLPGTDAVKVIFDGVNTVFEGPIDETGGPFRLLKGYPGKVDFTNGDIGTQIDFTVSDRDDGYRLYGLEVVKATVPEPGSVLGLVTVGALAIAAKKKTLKA